MRSGLLTGIAAATLALALAGCDQIKQMTGMDDGGSNAGASNTSTATGSPTLTAPAGSSGAPPKPPTANPALAAEMTAAAGQLSGNLPIQIDAITRVVAVRAEGTEFVYELQITEPIPAGNVETARETMQRNNQRTMCANANVSAFIRRGGSMNHRYTDSAGNRFETRVVSCP